MIESSSTKKIDPRNKLNELSGKEWIQDTNSVWFSNDSSRQEKRTVQSGLFESEAVEETKNPEDIEEVWYQRGLGKNHPHAFFERQHPAPFPYLMIERLLLFFTKRDDLVLDPFLGIGSTLKACKLNGRRGVGIELAERWVELARERLKKETGYGPEQKIIKGDSREVMKGFADNTFDFAVTSPPYANILNKPADHRVKHTRLAENLQTSYSEDKRDLANIDDYDSFLRELQKVWKECWRTLKATKYMVVVVADFRHKSKYIMYHADIAKSMQEVGFTPKGITIFVKNAKKLYPYGYPYGYVPNVHHEYIMIFKKEKDDGD